MQQKRIQKTYLRNVRKTANNSQRKKKQNPSIRNTHRHTLGKGFRAGFGNPLLQQEFASKTCKKDGVMCILGHGNRVTAGPLVSSRTRVLAFSI
jgi:phosphate starvation-inducible protein PhoH